jgi:hypothetical protein
MPSGKQKRKHKQTRERKQKRKQLNFGNFLRSLA